MGWMRKPSLSQGILRVQAAYYLTIILLHLPSIQPPAILAVARGTASDALRMEKVPLLPA